MIILHVVGEKMMMESSTQDDITRTEVCKWRENEDLFVQEHVVLNFNWNFLNNRSLVLSLQRFSSSC